MKPGVHSRGPTSAWLLAQHADLSPACQRRALELVKTAVAAGEASARHLAYLTDRVLVAVGEPQMYGTQYISDPDGSNLRPQPVADPERLDERRAAMGLEPAAEYDRHMRIQHLHLPESSGGLPEEEAAEPPIPSLHHKLRRYR